MCHIKRIHNYNQYGTLLITVQVSNLFAMRYTLYFTAYKSSASHLSRRSPDAMQTDVSTNTVPFRRSQRVIRFLNTSRLATRYCHGRRRMGRPATRAATATTSASTSVRLAAFALRGEAQPLTGGATSGRAATLSGGVVGTEPHDW